MHFGVLVQSISGTYMYHQIKCYLSYIHTQSITIIICVKKYGHTALFVHAMNDKLKFYNSLYQTRNQV